MRNIFSWMVLASLPIAAVAGCGPAVSSSELGRVVWDVPQVPGADKRYELPQEAKSIVPDPYELELQKRRAGKQSPNTAADQPVKSTETPAVAAPSTANPSQAAPSGEPPAKEPAKEPGQDESPKKNAAAP